ncbi:MAG: L-ribulose-5-phosphate 4-epimerase AraD [Candidatus Sulfotelmatobacter sp.]
MLERLKKEVLEANLELVRQGLVLYTFGNVSGIAREAGLVVIKPSGVPYAEMKPEHMVVADLSGNIAEGKLRPSSDLPTHLVLYNQFAEIGGVAHTHSAYATAWAQARKPIPCFGTTHADYFHGPVPVTSEMIDREITEDYEENTGQAIVQSLQQTNASATPGVLVANHGPFAWGADAAAATHNAVILEAIARMAYFTLGINPAAQPVGNTLHDKHYLRKHGKHAYYGQSTDTRKDKGAQ